MNMVEYTAASRTRILQRGQQSAWVHRQIALVFVNSSRSGEALALSPGITRVGTGSEAEVDLSDDAASALHFEVSLGEEGLQLRDLRSTNGTWVDGVRVERAWLHEGAEITAGTTTLRVRGGTQENQVALSRRTNFGGLLGHSPVMRSVFATLEQVAQSDATVLVQGESGTGKELAARALHEHSKRSDGPYVVFDCGAAPANLIESLLFGHQKGAFTGASEARAGVFETAHGGTLVFDEIGELPLLLQPKLLRALESKTIQRLGDTRQRRVDLRIVAATNRNLAQEARTGNFREDLFFRLSVITLRLPALRERREEIGRLVAHFLRQLESDVELPREALRVFEAHDWPGNVRELRNVVERLVTLPGLSPHEAVGGFDHRKEALSSPGSTLLHLPFHDAKERTLEHFEQSYLEHWLQESDGNVSQTARQTGLARQSVHRLIKKYGLDHSD